MPEICHTVSGTLKKLVIAIGAAMLLSAASRADTCAALSYTVAADRIAALSRGFNADGWLNGPQSTPPSAALLRELRKAGMTHVRLPVPAERLMRRFASLTERDDLLHELGRAIGTLASLGYSISIDLHPGDRFNQLHRDEPGASMEEMKRAWTDLSRIMKEVSSDRV